MKVRMKLAALFFSWIMAGAVNAGVILDNPILDTPILGGQLLVATDGHVYAEFLGSDAGYFNTLYLDTPSDWGSGKIFNKYSDVGGSPSPLLLDLGSFLAETELVFRIDVFRNWWSFILSNTFDHTVQSFFSGDGSRNPDGLAHVEAITTLQDGIYMTTVGFEDLVGGGDQDYNDFMFRLTNVLDPLPVSEPPVLFLLACGLIGLVLQRRRVPQKITPAIFEQVSDPALHTLYR